MNLNKNITRLLIAIITVSMLLPALPSAYAQPNPANCTTVGIAISLGEDVAKAHVGDTILHTVTVNLPLNTNCAVDNATINFHHPDGVQVLFQNITLGINATDPTSKTFTTGPYVVRQQDVVGGFVTATASVSGTSQFDHAYQTVTASNSIAALVIHPAISLSKTASAPKIENGSSVTYTYNAANTGDTALTVNISDDKLGVILAPTVLAAGASTGPITKNTTLTTTTTNTATATGMDQLGLNVTAANQSTVTVIHPAISLSKKASAPKIDNGSSVTYTYNAANTGDTALTVNISDDKLGVILAPTVLAAGASTGPITKNTTLTTTTTNTATATGVDQTGAKVTAANQSTVTVIHPVISLSKTASASKIDNGSSVTYTYNAANTGDTALTVNISDDKLGVILAPTVIAAGASTGPITKNTTLTTTTTNTATATGVDQTGAKITATNQSTVKVIHPAISLTKTASPTNGTAPLNVTYTYIVSNTGDTALGNVIITDNVFGAVGGPITLALGASQTFTKNESITANTTNIATATGTDQTGANVTAIANATVTIIPPPTGGQGCTPGFWKNNALKHSASQWPAPYTPTETLANAGFKNATVVNLGTTTLLDALQFQGGPGVGGAEQILLRSAVSALLNSAALNYPLTTSQVLSEVNAALATHNRGTILALASQLDTFNNLNCTLSQN